MDVLRKKGSLTRMLLLLRIVLDGPTDQKTLSEALGITPQAVSDYISKMALEGLIERSPKGPRATVEGVERLHHDLLTLKGFVDDSIQGLDIVRSTDAVASGSVRKGDRCGLFMKDGMLFARNGKKSSSMGVADADAEDGCMVPVSALTGVVEIEHGRLFLVQVPPARKGGASLRISRSDLLPALERKRGGARRIAALDMEAMALLRRSGIRWDSELPLPENVKGMLIRGLDVLAVGTPHTVAAFGSALEGEEVDMLRIGPVEYEASCSSGRKKG